MEGFLVEKAWCDLDDETWPCFAANTRSFSFKHRGQTPITDSLGWK